MSANQGVGVTTFTYTSDSLFTDPFGNATPRLASVTVGDPSDTSSSDDGNSIAGTYTFTYGPSQQGYNNWGPESRTNTATDALGRTTSTLFGLSGNVINSLTITGPDYAGAPHGANITRVLYTPGLDNPAQIQVFDAATDPNNPQPWRANFDVLTGSPTSLVDPRGATWQFSYQDHTELTAVTDPTQITWQFNYGEPNDQGGNPANYLTSLLDPGAAIRVRINYNTFGQPNNITVPGAVAAAGADARTSYAYDSRTGDLTKITTPVGDLFTVDAYDALGDPLSASAYPDTGNPATSQGALTSQVFYDAAQMPVQITAPNGLNLLTTFTNGVMTRFQTTHPSLPGQILSQMDLSYDSRGRVYAVSDQAGSLAQFKYNLNSSLTRLIDGEGNVTSFLYGLNEEPTGVLWPDLHGTTLAYNAAGMLVSSTDERGVVTQYGYDRAHRLTDIQFPNDPAQNVHYTLDDAGRLLSATDASGSRTYAYDPVRKRLTSVTTALSALPSGHNTFTVSYTYNGDGTVSSMTSPVGTTHYTYDLDGSLQSLVDPYGSVTSWTFDHSGRITGESTLTAAGATLATSYAYGTPRQPSTFLTSLQQTINGQQFWGYGLLHNVLGQVALQQGGGPQPFMGSAENFAYDSRGRLTSESDRYQPDQQTVFNSNNSYGYDRANNLLSSLNPVAPNGWSYNSSNQLTAAPYQTASPSLSGAPSLSYDAAGNTTNLGGLSLSYNAWGDMVGAGAATYAYDSRGRRVSKTVGGVSTYYLYAGEMLVAEVDAGGNLQRAYTWGNLGLISDNAPGQSRFYLYDGLGNTRTLVDANGQVLQQAAYTAWGAPMSASYPNTPFGWRGRFGIYYDSESGLFQIGARYYSPAIARFLSRDPSGFGAGANLYSYCAGDPVNFFDATGCEQQDSEGMFWDGVRDVAAGEQAISTIAHYAGLSIPSPASAVLGAHDSFQNWGSAEGNAKASPGEVWMARAKAGVTFGCAVAELDGTVRVMGEFRCIAAGGPKCFAAGTPVQIVHYEVPKSASSKGGKGGKSACKSSPRPVPVIRTKPIETLQEGDLVVSRNEKTGKIEFKKVLKTTVKTAPLVLTLKLSDARTGKVVESLTATREHPFYVKGKGFVPAGGLAVGNAIVTRAGPALIVKSITWNRRKEGYPVFNCVSEDDHTYFVGIHNGGVWVHNPIQCELDFDNLGPRGPKQPRYSTEQAKKGNAAEPVWRQWLENQGISLEPKANASAPGPDAEVAPGPGVKPGWNFAELKSRAMTQEGFAQINGRFE